MHLVHVKFLASELQVGKTSRQVDIWGYDHYESRQFNRFRESRVQPHNHADTFVMDSHTLCRLTELHEKLHQNSLYDKCSIVSLHGQEFMRRR